MSVFDVTVSEEEVTEIKWCDNDGSLNLVRSHLGEMTIKEGGLAGMLHDRIPLLQSVPEAENLIKAIQKAIDLGWFKK